MISIARSWDNDCERPVRFLHINTSDGFARLLREHLHAGGESIADGHTGQGAPRNVTGIDIAAGQLGLNNIESSDRHFYWLLIDETHLISVILKDQANSAG
ncbi:MAG: hypothetical protein ACTFAK_11820 [Candidatus Electronema sp. VV]